MNLHKIIEKEWVNLVAKFLARKIPNAFQSNIDYGCVVDKKLNHRKILVKTYSKEKSPYDSIRIYFIKNSKKDVPLKITSLALLINVNPAKLEECIETLFFEKIIIMDGWILAIEKRSIFKAMMNYGLEVNKLVEFSELYEKFSKKYNYLLNQFNIYCYRDYILYIRKRLNSMSDMQMYYFYKNFKVW